MDLLVQRGKPSSPFSLWEEVNKGLEKGELFGCGPSRSSHLWDKSGRKGN